MSLRAQVQRGGLYLAVRQGIGIPLGILGTLLLTRAIGPGDYGLYAAALGVLAYLERLSLWGIGVYLVRREGEDQAEAEHQAFSLLLLLALAGTALALAALPLLGEWTRVDRFVEVGRVLFLSLPSGLLGQVPLSRLERRLDFKRVARVELAAQVAFYVVALPMAFQGLGVWAPVAGWWARQLFSLGQLYAITGYRPRLRWDRHQIRQMVGYGLGYSVSNWVGQLRTLVNPLIVTRYAGAEAAGYVALAVRLVEALSFVKAVAWRLSIATLARLQHDPARLIRAVTEGMRLQVLALGFPFVAFGWLGPFILPALFGEGWLPVLEIYPFIALGYLTNAVFNLHASALYVVRRNWEVTAYNAAQAALFAGAAAVLVPRLGLLGYGWAEVVALASYAVIHAGLARHFGSPDYGLAALWWAAFGLALFGHRLGPFAPLGLLVAALWPATRRELTGLARDLRELRYGS